MSMHSLFADWLKESGLDPHDRPLTLWWQGLEDYCAKSARSSLLPLLRLAVIPKATEAHVPEGFREAIKEKDAEFSMRGNVFEIQQLARVAVRTLFDGAEVADNTARSAALGLISGSFGRENGDVFREHVQSAVEFVGNAADELRIRHETTGSGEINEKALREATDVAQLKTAVAPIVSSMLATLQGLTHRLLLQEEEANMLWWLFGERSRDLKVSFRSLSPGEAAIVAAKELADLTVFPPGPLSFEGILYRALPADSLDRKLKLVDAINSLNRNWLTSLAALLSTFTDASIICPLHLMITKSLEANSKKDWPVLLRAICDVTPTLKASPREISSQVYYERMFIKSLESVA